MSIIEPSDRTIGPDPVAPVTPPEPPVTQPEVAEETEPKVFDEAYVKELRAENAKWRTQLREYEQEFDGIDPDERRAMAELMRLSVAAQNGDEDAVAQLAELLGDDTTPPATPAAPPEFSEDYFRRLAREEVDRVAAEHDTRRMESEGIQDVIRRAEALGYKQGTPDYVLLMQAANAVDPSEHDDLIAAGHETVLAYKQSLIEAYLAEKEGRANTAPLVPPTGGVAPAGSRQLWTQDMTEKQKWAAVRDSFSERLRAAQGG